MPHLAVLKHINLVLCLRASTELELQKTDAAYDDLRLLLFLADSIRNEPLIISHLVRIAMLRTTRQVIWEGLAEHRWSDLQLQDLETQLQKIAILRDADQGVRAERGAFGNAEFALMRKHPSVFGNMFDSLPIPPIFFRILPNGWLYLEQVSYQRMVDEKILPGFDPEAARVHPHLMDDNAKDLEGLLKATAGNFLN